MASLRDLIGGLFGKKEDMSVSPISLPSNTPAYTPPQPTGLYNVGNQIKSNSLPAGTLPTGTTIDSLNTQAGYGGVLGSATTGGGSTTNNPPASSNNKTPAVGGNQYDASAMLKDAGIDSSQKGALFKQYGVSDTPSLLKAIDSARKAADAQLKSLNTQYDYTASQLKSQLPYLEQQRESGLSNLQTGFDTFTQGIDKAKTEANTLFTSALNKARQGASDTVKATRNALRGLGILGSSAAGEMLTEPVRDFDANRMDLNQQLTARLTELTDTLNTETAKNVQQIQSLESEYAQLIGNIQNDLRFNDRQREDAVVQAEAALQQRLAEIEQSQVQFEQQLALNAQSLAASTSGLEGWGGIEGDEGTLPSGLFPEEEGAQTETSSNYAPQPSNYTPSSMMSYDPLGLERKKKLSSLA